MLNNTNLQCLNVDYSFLCAAAGWSRVRSTSLAVLQRHSEMQSLHFDILFFLESGWWYPQLWLSRGAHFPPHTSSHLLSLSLHSLSPCNDYLWLLLLFLSFIFSSTSFFLLFSLPYLPISILLMPHFQGSIISSSMLPPFFFPSPHNFSSPQRMQRIRAQLPPWETPTGRAVSYTFIKTRRWIIHHNALHLQDTVSTLRCSKLPFPPSVPSCEHKVLHVDIQSQVPLGRQRWVNTASQVFVFEQDHYFYYCDQWLFS